MTPSRELSPFTEVLEAYRSGKVVIIIDDDDRENEGDLAVAAEFITEDAMLFMSRFGKGLTCVSIDTECASRLNIPLQVLNNNSPFQTPFTVSINHKSVLENPELPTSRAATMRALTRSSETAQDFVSPGYVFPLIAHPAGVLGRRGQTEGSCDLARLAGLYPSGVICEILDDDGSMLRGEKLFAFARQHNLPITSVEAIIDYRLKNEIYVRRAGSGEFRSAHGIFETVLFKDDAGGKEHFALVYGDIHAQIASGDAPLLRVHSECLTGDVFGSLRCDCGDQLDGALKEIKKAGAGIVLYLRQEGRGIGLTNKIRAYALQDQGADTVAANEQLGFRPDERDFAVAALILQALDVHKVRLLTNNPRKVLELSQRGIEVAERISLVIPSNEYSKHYLETKRTRLGHLFEPIEQK